MLCILLLFSLCVTLMVLAIVLWLIDTLDTVLALELCKLFGRDDPKRHLEEQQ